MAYERESSVVSAGNDADQDPSSSPRSTTTGIRQLELNRSSSPAKRKLDGGYDSPSATGLEQDFSAPKRQKSPKDEEQITSPLPSRHKPIPSIEIDNRDASNIDMADSVMEDIAADVDDGVEQVIGHGQIEDKPTLNDQVRTITKLAAEAKLVDGVKVYLVANRWLNRVVSRTTSGQHQSVDKDLRDGEIGPVDNSSIVANGNFYGDIEDHDNQKYVPLKPGLTYGEDFTCLPPEAWELVIQWYGVAEASHIVVRYAHETNPTGKSRIQYEIYPPILTIQRLRDPSEQDVDTASAPTIVVSRSESYVGFLRRAKAAAGIDLKNKVLVWKVLAVQAAGLGQNGVATPPASRETSPVRQEPMLTIQWPAFQKLVDGTDREHVPIKDMSGDPKFNGKSSTVDMAGFHEEQTIILEEQPKADDDFISEKQTKAAAALRVVPEQLDGAQSAKGRANARSSRQSSPTRAMTRSKDKNGRTRGCTGLNNLGNTCYMNSALQCIRSVEELAIYMLEERYKEEINSDNPLGHGGAIAKAYASFVSQVYQPSVGTFAPRVFKTTLGRCQPLFSGYGQQDSQEFLSFLVDGLHEDLNRIVKKPYRENPDSDDARVHDPEYIKELGEVYRDNHRARNDSVAMDLFSGFYKNTMVCPTCDKVSVTFDPYSLVTLQLPIQSTFRHDDFIFAPLVGNPVKVVVDIDKNSNIRMVKEYFAKRMSVKAENLFMIEAYSGKIYKVFDDVEVLAESNIQARDLIWVFELDAAPTNTSVPEVKKKRVFNLSKKASNADLDLEAAKDLMSERMAIPIIHRCSDVNDRDLLLRPWVILVTKEEARDFEKIRRKVLRSVDCMTTKDLFPASTRSRIGDETSDDTVILGQDDKDDDGVQARSVESEDEIVDISMTDSGANIDTQAEGVRSKKSPALDPDYFLDPSLSNAFALRIYGESDTPIPTGWNSVNSGSRLPLLESRVQRAGSRRESRQSETSRSGRGSHSANLGVDGYGSDDELSHEDALESSSPSDNEDISASPRRRNLRQRVSNAARSVSRVLRNGRRGSSTPPKELLIKPGEGLVVDWDGEAWNMIFGGQDENDSFRGVPTVEEKTMPVFKDEELEAKVARRNLRKKSGVTLDECFEETSKSEVLSAENAWYCGRCKELRRAEKTLEMWTAPDILVVHLKRFSTQSRYRDKIDVLVDAPVEGLDLTGKVGLPEGKSLIYDLFAVDNHYGGLGGGHYTAYAQNFFDKKWYEYNDSSVSNANPNGVVTKAAYLLFYRRREPKHLGPEYLRNLVSDAYAASATDSSSSLSLSGEDERRDGSISHGSSRRSSSGPRSPDHRRQKGQATNSSGRRLGSGSTLGGEDEMEIMSQRVLTRNDALDDDEERLPAYGERLPAYDEDEGIGMDIEGVNPDVPRASREAEDLVSFREGQSWSFANVGIGNDDDVENENLMADVDDIQHETGSTGSSVGMHATISRTPSMSSDSRKRTSRDWTDAYGQNGYDETWNHVTTWGDDPAGGSSDHVEHIAQPKRGLKGGAPECALEEDQAHEIILDTDEPMVTNMDDEEL